MYLIHVHFSFSANEFRAWLLHYSLPVLKDVLPAVYLAHFAMFVWAIHTLLLDNIPKARLNLVEEICDDFNRLTANLYGM